MRNILLLLVIASQIYNPVNARVDNKLTKGLPESNQTTSVTAEPGNLITLNQLGYTDKVMVGPYGTASVLFSLPSTWQLTSDGTLTLYYSFTGGVINNGLTNQTAMAGGTLTVYFNNVVIDTIVLNQSGNMTALISLPTTSLTPAADGRYKLSFFFDASVNCNYLNVASTLVISSSSTLNLQHQVLPPPTDLSNFPRPIYQPQSIVPTNATLVLADRPSPNEMQAALAVAAGLGSITNGELAINTLPISQLGDNIRNSNNLIFIGLPSDFPVLAGMPLPLPARDNKFSITGSDENDGIIQMAVSPWNPGNVILLISGNNDAAVLKAGRALSAGHPVTGGRADVSLISNVNPNNPEAAIAEDRTFSDLGYDNQTLGSSFSGQYLDYLFPASSDQAASTESYLDIVTSHSNLLNYDKSGVSVLLNGDVIGTLSFTQNSDQVTTTRIKLLPSVLHRGENRLEIISDLIPIYNCYSQNLGSTWVTISQSSLIHLPHTAQVVDYGKSADLKNYPTIFLTDKYLGDTSFILPQNDPTAWDSASQVAYYLGYKGSIPFANLRAAYGNNIPDDIKKQQSMMVFGLASTLPIISELKDVLPAPFQPGSNEALQPAMLVNYRLLPGNNVGYIELMTSPWNPDRLIMAVMGNTSQGISLAGQALINEKTISKLSGNFSILYGTQILTTDTRLGPSTGQLIGGLPVVVTVIPTESSSNNPSPQPEIIGEAGWVLPAIIGTTLLVVLTLLFILRNSIKERLSNRKFENKTDEGID